MTILRRWAKRELTHPVLRGMGSCVFCAFLALIMARTLLVQGNTGWTEDGIHYAVEGNRIAEPVIHGLGLILLALELVADWRRGLVSAGLILLWRSGWVNIYQMIPLEMLIVLSLCNLSAERPIRVTWLAVHGLYFILLMVLLGQGLVTESLTFGTKSDLFSGQGTSLGMVHPNTLAQLFMTSLMMIWIDRNPRKLWPAFPVFWAAALGIFYLTRSRAAALVLLVFPPVAVLCRQVWGLPSAGKAIPGWLSRFARKWEQDKARIALAAALPVLALLISLGISLMYVGKPAESGGDKTFGLRFTDFTDLLQGGIMPFGRIPSGNVYLDNFYQWCLYCCGWAGTALFIGLYAWMTGRLARRGRDALLTAALMFLVYAFMENALVFVTHFFVPLLAFCRERPRQGSR